MGHYGQSKPYYLKDRREVVIDMFLSKGNISKVDYMALKVADQIEQALDKYRQEAATMSKKGVRTEEHDSARSGKYRLATHSDSNTR